jgi:beta,beta-carotene 9',10'-dioxygenase
MSVTEQQQTRSDYRQGFQSLLDEVDLDRLEVDGSIPGWLAGTLVRNGPARFEVGERSFRHWFDGLAMLHAFSFADGRVSYRNRFVRGAAHDDAERGQISHRQFATDPCRSLFKRFVTSFQTVDAANPNVNVVRLGDRFLAMTETPIPVEFDPRTLRTLGVARQNRAPGQITIAHPHADPVTGELVSYAARLGPRSSYKVYAQTPGGRPRVIASIPVQHPAYMHSFAITERYAVLTEWPLVVDPLRLAVSGLRGRPFIENYEWQPGRGTRFHVVDLRDGSLRGTYQASPAFSFHHVNAFERDGRLVMDAAVYSDASLIDELYLDRLRTDTGERAGTRLHRYTIDLAGGSVDEQPIAPGFELPRINYRRHNGRPYRFAWGLGERGDGFLDTIQKADVEAGEVATWAEDGCFPGEPVFVPAPDASAEDDGVILSVVLDGGRGTSFLVVLDAGDMTELGRARVPHHIPFGFHGQYFGGVGS